MDIEIMDVKYKIAKALYIGAGGDPTKQFDSIEEIYEETARLYDETSSRITVEPLNVEVISNGEYEYNDDISGYKPVSIKVNVDVGTAYEDGYNNGVIAGQDMQKQKLSDITISLNGSYMNEDGYKNVNVEVPMKLDFTRIGYSEETSKQINDRYNAYIEYTLSVANKFDTITTSAKNLFEKDKQLVYAPVGDTSKVTNMNSMFFNCTALQTIPLYDTSNVTDMRYMLQNCSLLVDVPLFDTSKVTNMYWMFYRCTKLRKVPLFNTSKVTNMNNMFYECESLEEVPQFDTSNVGNMEGAVYRCFPLTYIPKLDTSNVYGINSFLDGCDNITDIGGFINLGKNENLSGTTYAFSNLSKLTKQSMLNIMNNLYDRASAGYSILTLRFHANSLALLTDEDIAIATNKGWIIS